MRFKRIRNFFKKKNSTPWNNRKKVGILLFATSIGLFFLFAARLTYVVVVGDVAGHSLKKMTANLYQGSRVVKAKRGIIYDRNGVVIAEDATSYSIYIVLSDTYVSGKTKLYAEEKNFEKIADVLHDQLGSKKETVLKTLENGKKNKAYQIELGNETKNLTLEKKKKIEELLQLSLIHI